MINKASFGMTYTVAERTHLSEIIIYTIFLKSFGGGYLC